MVTLTGPAVGAACPFLLEPQPVTNTSRATKRAGTRQQRQRRAGVFKELFLPEVRRRPGTLRSLDGRIGMPGCLRFGGGGVGERFRSLWQSVLAKDRAAFGRRARSLVRHEEHARAAGAQLRFGWTGMAAGETHPIRGLEGLNHNAIQEADQCVVKSIFTRGRELSGHIDTHWERR